MSKLLVNLVEDLEGRQQLAARAWVNMNTVTSVPTIRASAVVSSVTDNAVGDVTVSLLQAMADANYVLSGQASNNITTYPASSLTYTTMSLVKVPTASQARVVSVYTYNPALYDSDYLHVVITR